MNDDDLRDKLTDLAARDMYQREGIYEQPGCPWDDLFDSEHKHWRETVTPTIDALMPVIREALAQAWDDGYRAANDDLTDSLLDPEPDHPSTPNPWREEEP